MLYYREISLKDQRKCLLKNAERADAAAFLHYFTQAHAETDFLTTYADEGTHSVEDMEERLAAQGLGAALTGACIDCAKEAGFRQLELEVVGDNENAVRLYKKYGFVEYGRNPRGFLTRDGRWQELVLMRLELEDAGARENDAGNGESDVF